MSNARNLAQLAVTPLGFKNRLINGDMRINQRNWVVGGYASIVTNAANSVYTLDRWRVATQYSDLVEVLTGATAALLHSFSNYIRVKCKAAVTNPAADTFVGFGQIIEGTNLQDFAFGTASAKPFTLSFWTRSLTPGTYPVSFRRVGQARAYTTTFTVNVADVWEKKVVTVPADTAGPTSAYGITEGLQVWFDLGSGANYAVPVANVWGADSFTYSTISRVMANINNFLDFTGMQLEIGAVPTPNYEHRPYGLEFGLCQRYYNALNTTASYTNGFGAGATTLYVPYRFPPMRVAPTIVMPPATAAIWRWDGIDDTPTINWDVHSTQPDSFSVRAIHASGIAGVKGNVYKLNAEL